MGVAADATALIVPGLPGGAGVGIKAIRNMRKAADVADVVGGAREIKQGIEDKNELQVAVGTFQAAAGVGGFIKNVDVAEACSDIDFSKIDDIPKGTGKLDNLISAKSLGKGSTDRTIANSLKEQLAMKEVLSNPLDGAEYLRRFKMGDTRWSADEGWQKMQRIIETFDGTKINIHFNYNKITGFFDDFKFKQTILPKK